MERHSRPARVVRRNRRIRINHLPEAPPAVPERLPSPPRRPPTRVLRARRRHRLEAAVNRPAPGSPPRIPGSFLGTFKPIQSSAQQAPQVTSGGQASSQEPTLAEEAAAKPSRHRQPQQPIGPSRRDSSPPSDEPTSTRPVRIIADVIPTRPPLVLNPMQSADDGEPRRLFSRPPTPRSRRQSTGLMVPNSSPNSSSDSSDSSTEDVLADLVRQANYEKAPTTLDGLTQRESKDKTRFGGALKNITPPSPDSTANAADGASGF